MAKHNTPGKDVAVGEQLELATSCDGDAAQAAYVAAVEALTPDEQRRTIRRIDVRLVSTLGFLYCVSLMDRNNTGIAMISGMSTDLVMTGSRYSIVVLLFFIPYVLFQPPSTAILRKVGPRLFLSLTTLVWGLATIASGFVKNWSELIPLRLILGACEAGFFPGVLALGFSQLDGHGAGPSWWGRVVIDKETGSITVQSGISGWRWIFILQGVLTCVVAGFAYLTVLGFPDAVSHVLGLKLSKREADFIVARIELDRGDATTERFSLREYMGNAYDLKIWGFAALFGLTTVNTYAIAYFLPLILKDGLGFSVAVSQCLIAPPYIAAGVAMYTMAYLSDKYRIRSPFIVFNGCLLLVGLPLLGFATNVGARYFGAFVTTTACNANVPCILTWQANNIRGQWKRALCSATLVGTGGIGGIIGSTVFRSQDAPGYRPGIYAAMIASSLIILITLALDVKFFRANKRAAAGGKIIGGLEGFRYTL
ncbi:hypothetical protein SAPIO_CDS7878 [Scedosporium apiospermum]|uniref:Phthalate transporter n=1 Tax=Pseudallescheria apiosperma TaxID=563466 RepID=A0A084G0M3_PSEDA|nr:uncharacterized protein SAPIO_CDS7878 [Scedosporium apiospermum]KEZ40885.1 hypothetical protein SAPIO_CDS7878 [Scedosporium apiospermum]